MLAKETDMSDLELKYHDITELYDLAEELLETADSQFISDPEEQLALVEPLIETVGESADVLTEMFCDVAGKEKTANSHAKKKVEGSLRKMYVAIDAYRKKAKKLAKKSSQTLINIADPIVAKIKRQVEVIVANFIDFIDISLDMIMQKTQIEELKRRQEKIAIMLQDIGHDVEFGR